MRRLVYAPRAYAFIHSDSLGQIVDVSDDIVSGWVDSNDSDMSKAGLVLRNVGRKYIRTQEKKQIFQCDDLITIWLQRLPGKPVQVFTGYLDEVPLWQMYPGDCRISASCTMKRLAYTWFDPGSDYFIQFANRQGWTYSPESGTGFSAQTYGEVLDENGRPTRNMGDGGFGKFLFDFLTEIAGWNQEMVMIGEVDASLPERASELYHRQVAAIEEDTTAFAEVMRQMIGLDVIDTTTEDGIYADGETTPLVHSVVRKVDRFLKDTAVPLRFALFAAQHGTQLNASYAESSDQGDAFGYGLYRMRPPIAGVSVTPGGLFTPPSIDLNTGDSIRGRKFASFIGNAKLATEVFVEQFNEAMATHYSNYKTRRHFLKAVQEGKVSETAHLMRLMNLHVDEANMLTDIDNADKYVKSVINNQRVTQPDDAATTGSTVASTKVLTWESVELTDILSDKENETVRNHYKSHHVSLVPYLYYAKKKYGEKVKVKYVDGMHKESLYLTGEVTISLAINSGTPYHPTGEANPASTGGGGVLFDLYGKFVGHEEVTSVTLRDESDQIQIYMREGVQATARDSGDPTARVLSPNTLRIVMSDANAPHPDWIDLPVDPDLEDNAPGDASTGAGDLNFSFQQLGRFSTIAALHAQYSFPADIAESALLSGSRAVMNDISCLDGAKQFAQGSMRNLMSLPNGRLCAYYPDYFGTRRGPYWYVRDIEIINLGIQLTDGPLATHVFVTGDTTTVSLQGQVDLADRIYSHGVVSVFNVELLNAFMVPGSGSITVGKEKAKARSIKFEESTARRFLNKHGMRPLKEENPLIKNNWYEFLMAWQRFIQQWAATFDTKADFTFQPEIMAGGIIGFQTHGLQTYVKQVRHDFSYADGFNTSATLTAPAAIYTPETADATDVGSLPGMIIAGEINTVGATP